MQSATPIGITNLNLVVFLIYSTLGTVLWTGVLAYPRYVLGKNYGTVSNYLDSASYIVVGSGLASCAIRLAQKGRRRVVCRTGCFPSIH